MKTKTTFLALIMMLAMNTYAAGLKLTKGTYNIDSAHTRASFTIPHFVVSEVQGRFNDVKGTFNLSEKIEDSKVNVTIPVASIDTGVAKRDEHLKSSDFFDVAKFPEIKFVSKKFTGKLSDFKVFGDLTIKNVTKEVILSGKYTGSVKDSSGNERAAVRASAKINRKDFNIMYNDMIEIGPAVGDEVTIHILTEGILEMVKK